MESVVWRHGMASLCEQIVPFAVAKWRRRKELLLPLITLVVLFISLHLLLLSVLYGRNILGVSERGTITQRVKKNDLPSFLVIADTNNTSEDGQDTTEQPLEPAATDQQAAVELKYETSEALVDINGVSGPLVKVEGEDDFLEYPDEMKGFEQSVREDPPDKDSVAFLVPLRGIVGDLGLRLGRQMKRTLEKSLESTGNLSQFVPSSILVRDSQCDPEISRSLTKHFYEVHGVTRYFGLLTDEEAMAVALWARAEAPGARFVTPTATSPYLERARNVAMVQPPGSLLAAAVTDFLRTVQSPQALVVARASLHTDLFLSLLRSSGLRPLKVMRYYHTTNMSELAWSVQSHLLLSPSPVIVLGDAESWYLIEATDQLISAVWILPFPTQLCDRMQTKQSEIVTFMYRAHDDVPDMFLQKQPMLSPTQSLINASIWLLNGRKRNWQGSYIVAANVAVNSVSAGIRLLGISEGWLPLFQYDINSRGMLRRLYQELLVTKDLLKPLLSGDKCILVIRYQEELTGERKVSEMSVHSSLPTLLVPAERGAQLHVDCPHQHADVQCSAPKGTWAPVTCQGSLQGHHVFVRECGRELGIRVAASQGCTGAQGLVCRGGRSLGCLLSGLCTTLSVPLRPIYQCDGLNLDTLEI